MADIIIRFITEPGIISEMIRDVTWGPFSHVEFVLDDGRMLGAHASGGVQIRSADYCRPTAEERYRITVTDLQKAEIMAEAYAQIGKPYDFAAIAGIVTHRDWRNKGAWICSEYLAYSFEKGFPLLHIPGDKFNRVTPMMDYLSPHLIGNCIYQYPEPTQGESHV